MRKYSRMVSIEQRRNRRKTFYYLFLSGSLFLILIFVGIPALAKVITVVSDFKQQPSTILNNDKIPPSPPRFTTSDTATNSARLTLIGSAEPSSHVTVYQNGKALEEELTDIEGQFSQKVVLFEGENIFVARARDEAGNTSQNSSQLTIQLDKDLPEITITSPTQTTFAGGDEQTVIISGNTNKQVNLTINNRFITLDVDNKFSYAVKLVSGDNQFKIVATDDAGNSAELDLTLNFTP
ncbi:hypothetical protein HY404_00415 [Candidatus Microgenomates bacterium]|nr:hypothetical protein [Candidatus Microgenomates bacterium]